MSTAYVPNTVYTAYGLDKGWIMTSTGFLLFMLVGLGFMEIGSIRRKNSRIVWFKILLNIICTTFWWYILGFAFAFGNPNGSFLGGSRFYAGDLWAEPLDQGVNSETQTNIIGPGYSAQFAHFVWRVALSLIAIQIVTGMLTERITFKAIAFYNIVFNIVITPFIFSWTYGFGFLVDDIGYRDYAGSFIVFGTGAFAGLMGLILIKPRYNRYEKLPPIFVPTGVPGAIGGGGELRSINEVRPIGQEAHLPPVAFDKLRQEPGISSVSGPMTSTAFTIDNIIRARKRQDEEAYEHFGVTDFGLLTLGSIITFIAFLFFNAGASQGLQAGLLFDFAERAFANTILAAMGGGLFAMCFLALFRRKRPVRDNIASIARSFVAGMVAVAADCNVYAPWAALTIGVLGAISYLIMAYIFYKAHLDDPAEFFPMFGGAAICGIIVSAFFNTINGIFYDNSPIGEVLIWQILSLTIISAWAWFISLITFFILKKLRMLRVGLKTEVVGYDYIDGARTLDYPDHGIEKLEKQKVK